MNSFSLWPVQASAHAGELDLLILSFSLLVLTLAAPIFVLIAVFAVKYRRGKQADRSHQLNRSIGLETSWAVIPFLLVLGFFVWACWLYFELQRPPPDALGIDVVAKQWMWKFQHPGGQGEIDELHVPVGQAVRLTMTSQDVIHSLYIPALRVKQDVLPGRYTTMWFEADRPGVYRLACTEFCGTDHSVMGGAFYAMTLDAYARWLEESDVDQSLAAKGEALFRTHGCSGCHGPSATVHAPSLAGLYGNPVPLASGEVVTADAEYIRDSILLPNAQVAAGYAPIMPTFRNLLSEKELLQIVAYIQALDPDHRSDAE